MNMFCYQCEQTARGSGCTTIGVCGKQPDVAALQDLIVYQLQGVGYYAHHARLGGAIDVDVNLYTVEALFSTVTNVDFDAQRLDAIIRRGDTIMERARRLYENAVPPASRAPLPAAAHFKGAATHDGLKAQGAEVGILASPIGEDIRSLQQLLTYGLKGMAAYVHHAFLLGKSDDTVFGFIHEALAALNRTDCTPDFLLDLCMKCGTAAIRAMEILDLAHTGRFGHPRPTPVATGVRAGPAIIVSGHDLLDLELLLRQTESTGIAIYTHGEMLPAHGYPNLKRYMHLAGHFGTAWQNQQIEFNAVPAAILFTTNCIQKPLPSYLDRVFTTGLVAFPGVTHIAEKDFSAIIQKAKELGEFKEKSGKPLMTGFGHEAVLAMAGEIIEAVKNGAIRRFLLIGGCDGTKPGRNYYTELVENAPRDTVVLTLACGKFRFNHLDLGETGGIPRLIDFGQCNDAFSALKIAQALADAFKCGINELPLSFVLSWYEQKAVAILLALLSLGIKGIRLGPSLPAFLSPGILKVLVETFEIKPVTTARQDLAEIMK